MELPLEVRRDAAHYLSIFNDYMDFKIKPWDKHGIDKGVLFPVRKNALRLLKKEIIKQKQEAWDKAHDINRDNGEDGNTQEKEPQQEPWPEMRKPQAMTSSSSISVGERKSKRSEHNRSKHPGGEKYTEVIENKAEFRVPEVQDMEDWGEDSWMKFAAPLELEAYFKEHPEKAPPGWVPPSQGLETREQMRARKKKEKEEKLKAMNSQNSSSTSL